MKVVNTEPVWTALQTRLTFLHTGHLLGPEYVRKQLEAEAEERNLKVMHATAPDELARCPDEPTLVLVVGFESLVEAADGNRCQKLSNWRAAVQDLLSRCDEARIVLQSRVPKTSLGGCPGSQLIIDATPAFLRADPFALVAAARSASNLPPDELERWAHWYGNRAGLVLALADQADPEAGRKQRLADANEQAEKEYIAAFEELGPDVVATIDHYVTELEQFELDFSELDAPVVDALRGAGFVDSVDDGQTIVLLPGRDQPRMRSALRTVVDSTLQLPSGYLQSVQKLWLIERGLRWEVRQILADRHGRTEWIRHIPLPEDTQSRVVSRAAQDAFPRAESCQDLPNPLEWLTLGELIDMILSHDTIRPFGVSDAIWLRMRAELAPVRDRIAHMRLLRDGDERIVGRWQRQVGRLQSTPN